MKWLFFVSVLLVLSSTVLEARKRSSRHKNAVSPNKLIRLKLDSQKSTIKIGNPAKDFKYTVCPGSPDTYSTFSADFVRANKQCKKHPDVPSEEYVVNCTPGVHFNVSDKVVTVKDLKTIIAYSKYNRFDIGMGPNTLKSEFSFIKQAIEKGHIAKPQATIRYEPCQPNQRCTIEGEVTFGGFDVKKCSTDGKSLQVEEINEEWIFQVTSYTLNYSDVESKTAFDDQKEQKLNAVIVEDPNAGLELPENIFNKVLEVTKGTKISNSDGIIVPCNSKFEFHFTLTDNKGNSVEWTIDQNALYEEYSQSEMKCILYVVNSNTRTNKNQIALGTMLYRSACVHFDFEKNSIVLSPQLKQ